MESTAFELKPRVVGLAYGGWMATTGPETKLRIAVLGASQEEARARFNAALGRWKEISERAEDQEQSPPERA